MMKSLVFVMADRLAKDLQRVPAWIESKLLAWMKAVRLQGLEVVRRIPGYHDEPLKGLREGQRSIRLNRSYRAIYEVTDQETIRIVEIKEVTKHDY